MVIEIKLETKRDDVTVAIFYSETTVQFIVHLSGREYWARYIDSIFMIDFPPYKKWGTNIYKKNIIKSNTFAIVLAIIFHSMCLKSGLKNYGIILEK